MDECAFHRFYAFQKLGQVCDEEMLARATELSRRTKGIADPWGSAESYFHQSASFILELHS